MKTRVISRPYSEIHRKFVLLLVVAVLMGGGHCGTVPAAFTYPNTIQAHLINLITSPTQQTNSFNVSYPITSFGSSPTVVMGIYQWYQQAQNIISWNASITAITKTYFTVGFVVSAQSTINIQNYYFMAMDSSFGASVNMLANANYAGDYSVLSSGTGSRCSSAQVTYATETALTTPITTVASQGFQIVVFVQGLTIQNTKDSFQLSMAATMYSPTVYQLTICTGGSTALSYVYYSRFIFNETALEQSRTNVDWGKLVALSSSWTGMQLSYVQNGNFNHSCFVAGLSSFNFSHTATVDYMFSSSSLTSSGGMAFDLLEINYWYYYQFACTGSPYLYFNSTNGMCTDSCVAGYYADATASKCALCSYSCLTCSGSATGCQSCPANSFRTFSRSSCPCNTGYVDASTAVCQPCSNYLTVACLECSSQTVCTTCDIKINFQLNAETGQCECATGFTNVRGSCQAVVVPVVCPTGCLTCDVDGCITCDTASYYVLSGTACVCDSANYFVSTDTGCACDTANHFVLSGSTCVCDSANHYVQSRAGCVCDSANNFVQSGTSCVCNTNYYLSGAGCVSCTSLSNCLECSSATVCTKCLTGLTLNGGKCLCATTNMYYDASTTSCALCNTTCLTCSSSTTCLTCSSSANRVLSGSACICATFYSEDKAGTCVYLSTCPNGYQKVNNVCTEICGDGFLYVLECDDGNLNSGDGCSSTCKIETNFTCRNGSPTAPSQCSYNKPLSLSLVSSSKDLFANAVNFTLNVTPVLQVLNTFNFSSILSSTLPTSSLSATYSNGTLMVRVAYVQSIQLVAASLSVTPSTSFNNTFDMKASSTSFTVDPQNSQAFYYATTTYDTATTVQLLFRIAMAVTLATLLVNLFLWKLVGIESLQVLQVLFLVTCLFSSVPPVLGPNYDLWPTLGYNRLFNDFPTLFFFDQPPLSKTLTQMQIGVRFAENLNYMIAFEILIILFGAIFFLVSRCCDTREYGLLKFSKELLNEVLMVLVLFSCLNFGFSVALHAEYWTKPKPQAISSHFFNILVMAVALLIMLVNWAILGTKQANFERTISILKKQSKLARIYPILLGLQRIILGVGIAVGTMFPFGTVLPLSIQLIYSLFLCFKRPYKKGFMNVRLLINEFSIVVGLASTVIYSTVFTGNAMAGKEPTDVVFIPAWLDILSVLLTVLINFCCTVYIIYKTCSKSRTAEVHPKDNVSIEQDNQSMVEIAEHSTRKLKEKKAKQSRKHFEAERSNAEKIHAEGNTTDGAHEQKDRAYKDRKRRIKKSATNSGYAQQLAKLTNQKRPSPQEDDLQDYQGYGRR